MSRDPDTVECATCGGTAEKTAWGATPATCYRCQDCPAGGHIAPDGTKIGPVFSPIKRRVIVG